MSQIDLNSIFDSLNLTQMMCGDDPQYEEFRMAMEKPIEIKESVNKVNNSISETSVMIGMELPHVRFQINFRMPLPLIKASKKGEMNAKNIIKDIKSLKKAYEEQATLINNIIDATNETIRDLYIPLQNTRINLKEYIKNFIDSICELMKTIKNKRSGLDSLNSSNYKERMSQIFEDKKKEIDKEINSFTKDSIDYQENYQNNVWKMIDKISKFVDNFKILIDHIESLSKEILAGFKKFEGSNDKFKKYEDEKVVLENIELLKAPLGDIINLIRLSNDKFLVIEQIVQTFRITDSDELKEQMDNICKRLEKKSKEILGLIEKTREALKEKPVELLKSQSINSCSNVSSFNETLGKLGNLLNNAAQNVSKKQVEIKKKSEKAINKTRLDILFIMDITNTMSNYLQQAQNSLLKMVEGIQKNCATAKIHLGFIGYKDICDLEMGDEYVNIDFSDKYKDISEQIKDVEADGGGDEAEDVCGAYKMAKEKSWGEGSTKIAIFVADAPCHGYKYHDLRNENSDNYPKEGTEIEEYVRFFAVNEISLFCAKISDTTTKMFGIFADIYNKNKPNGSNCKFIVGKMDNLSSAVIDNATKIYNERKDEDNEESK